MTKSQLGRELAALRKTYGGGRPRREIKCPRCGKTCSAREIRLKCPAHGEAASTNPVAGSLRQQDH